MVDHGANGGLAGLDMRVLHKTQCKINIQGIDNHEVTGLDVVTAVTLLNTSQGKVIGIFNEYAYLGKGSSIHSSGQLEWFKTTVDEKSVKVGGTQLIASLDGYSVPLLIKDGLAYATSLGKPTDQDMDTYPHVSFTSPDEWDPSVLDHDPPHLDGLDPSQVPDQPFGDPMFDAYGDFNERIIANLNILLDAPPEVCGSYTEITSVFTANLHQSSPQEPDWNALCPFFAWTSPSSIKDTFNVTTRHGTAPHTQDDIKKHFKSRNPAVGPLEYHVGCTYKKDPDGTLAADPRRYVNKILESYERMFKEKPRKSRPPLEGGDHPELDTSELCYDHQTKQFQTLIGQLLWLISLGRFDIAVHVISLSIFRAQPRKGHLHRAKRIVGYLLFLPDGAIRFRTGEPDFSSLKDQEYDWTRSVYSGACEQIPHNIPKPLGKHVQTTHYVDANLHHDLATGKAVTAVLHFLNQTPIDAFTKRQSTVETATYGSEFVAATTAVDQIIDICTTLR